MSICLVIKIICFYRRNCAKFERRVCSKGQGLKNREISNISRQRNDNRHRLSIHGNIAKKSAKSPIYRRNIGEAPINRRKIASGGTRGEVGGGAQKIAKNIADISVFLPIFRKISRYFLPVQPAQLCFSAWLKNNGFRVREI